MEKDSLLQGESKNVEYKEMVPEDSQKYMKSVVAFANGDGGRIVFGIEDGTMQVVGIPQSDLFRLMDAITNAVTDSCAPMIIPDLFIQEVKGKSLIILEIAPGMQRPYYIKKKGLVKGTYIRTAGTTRPADQAMLQELLLEGKNKFFDQQPIPNLKVKQSDVAAECGMYQITTLQSQHINYRLSHPLAQKVIALCKQNEQSQQNLLLPEHTVLALF